MPKPYYKIQNVVASVKFKNRFDYNEICLKFPQSVADYCPENFPGLFYRGVKTPKCSMLIFENGKMICTGAKSTEKVKKGVYHLIRDFKKREISIHENPEIDIVNIVASGNLRHEVDLEKAASTLIRVMYEPEQFPGLFYRIDNPKPLILLFKSGKFVCTGATKEIDIDHTVEILYQTLEDKNLFISELVS